MSEIINIISNIVLPLPRVFGFLFLSPIPFPYQTHHKIKAIFGIIVGISLAGYVKKFNLLDIDVLISEFLIGMSLGFIVKLAISIFSIIGSIIDFQGGLMMNRITNPINPENSTIFSSILSFIGLFVFIAMDMHTQLIKILASSFELIPPQKILFEKIIDISIKSFLHFFMLGIKYSIPLMFSILIVELIIGILSKIMPTANFLILGQPLRFLSAIFSVAIFLSFFYVISENILFELNDYITKLINI